MGEITYIQTFQNRILNTVSTKIKVLCLSIWYPMSISRYFEKALRHRYDLDVKTVGSYTGSWIPWMGTGMNLPEKYAIPPDISLPFSAAIGEINYDLVRAMLPEGWVPDIVLCIDAGIRWKYKPSEGLAVHIATDPHVLNDLYDKPRKYSDKFFNMQLCYSQKGDIYLPYAYSQYDHYPEQMYDETGIEQPKDIDAVLIGMPYENRVQWINQLRAKGLSVIFENGPVFDEARQLYNRGRIGLNWSSMNDLNARAFEVPAMGLFPVLNYVPDMEQFNIWREISSFRTMDDAVERVLWAKEHPEDAKMIAQETYERVLDQTYDLRIDTMLKECGFV